MGLGISILDIKKVTFKFILKVTVFYFHFPSGTISPFSLKTARVGSAKVANTDPLKSAQIPPE